MAEKGKKRKEDAPDKYLPIADGIDCRFDSDSDEIRCKIGSVTRRARIGDMPVLDEADLETLAEIDETRDNDPDFVQSQNKDGSEDSIGADNCDGKTCKAKSRKPKKKSLINTELARCIEEALKGGEAAQR